MMADSEPRSRPVRRLLVVLGDQLDQTLAVPTDVDPERDLLWMCEATSEAIHVPSHRARTVLFLAAMRRFAEAARGAGLPLRYLALDQHAHPTLAAALRADLTALRPDRVWLIQPGEWRVHTDLSTACHAVGYDPHLRTDTHFMCRRSEFERWAAGRKALRQEHFYRWMRRRHQVLLDDDGAPTGGAWNFDRDNRRPFGKRGPGAVPAPLGFAPDATTRAVMDLVARRFPAAPGRLDGFDWPLTPAQAQAALRDFIAQRLPVFGPHQDAMWDGEPYLYHARLSAALNLKLLDPRQVIAAAVAAYQAGAAPLGSVEGFVRQVLGWREYVRGVYWQAMPAYLDRNALGAEQPLPNFYWTGATDAACLRAVIEQVLTHGYAHHIQRLMVTGLFALLLGVAPRAIHAWYLAMFVDAVEWVEAPNTLGMSQYADGGLLASKPYVASGAYIARMSNYCQGCRYDPRQAVGARACPFTTLYWDFLARHRERFANHPRTALMWRNLDRIAPDRLTALRTQAETLRAALA